MHQRSDSAPSDAAIATLLEYYRDNRQEKEEFAGFVDRVGREPFEQVLEQFAEAPVFEPAAHDFYQDWERKTLYKVERGEGECAM